MKLTTERANDQGWVTLDQLKKIVDVDDKILRRLELPYRTLPGFKRKFYKLTECLELIKDYRTVEERSFIFQTTCQHCSKTFVYEKIIKCSGRTARYIEKVGSKYSGNNKTWCGECSIPKPPMTAAGRKNISEFKKKWWGELSDAEYERMCGIFSEKKQLFWDRKPGLKKKLGEKIKEAYTWDKEFEQYAELKSKFDK